MIELTDEMVRAFMRAYAGADDGSSKVILEDAAEKAGLAAVLAIVERDQAAELADLRALFQLQWTRMGEATARWRAEDPDARAHVMPDLGALLQWLMDDADRARGHA